VPVVIHYRKNWALKSIGIFVIAVSALAIITRADGKDAAKPKPIIVRAITYNICGLPDAIIQERGLPLARERFPEIGLLLRKYDIIGLQEVFVPERTLIEKKLFMRFIARGTDSGIAGAPGSGIYIYSRWKIPKLMFERWNDITDYDAMSQKGFVAATVEIERGPTIDVYSLHAQAGHKQYRAKNYEQLFAAMKQYSLGSGRPILVLGDFNCDISESECKYIVENAGLTHVSTNPAPDQIDHIFYNMNGSDWKITVLSSQFVFDKPMLNGKRLSDHDGFEAVLQFDRK
jgi:endonuclease/exonuclease/phosphatase family metal-dependent hydrolase